MDSFRDPIKNCLTVSSEVRTGIPAGIISQKILQDVSQGNLQPGFRNFSSSCSWDSLRFFDRSIFKKLLYISNQLDSSEGLRNKIRDSSRNYFRNLRRNSFYNILRDSVRNSAKVFRKILFRKIQDFFFQKILLR